MQEWTGVEIGGCGESHEIAFQLRQSGTELTGVLMSEGRDSGRASAEREGELMKAKVTLKRSPRTV